jgi:DMSO/TMAO reductase YedYZ molybdopterin-dependent catalytic subunit
VDGEVATPLNLSIDDLKSRFEVVRLKLQLECGGNGRAGFNPPARGNQWTLGAVANAEWTGVRYGDLLRAAGIKDTAVYTAHYGADAHLSGDPNKLPISRGVPIWKAMDRHSLIAFEMNGRPIHPMNGAPLRVVAPGWPGSCSQKWLKRVQIRDQVHDGAKMTGTSYRVPAYPVEPGEKVDKADFRIIQSMPVKSLITYPESGAALGADNRMMEVRGHAWAGDRSVAAMDVSLDFGASWMAAELDVPPNTYAWRRWRARIAFPRKGYYEVWARAADH